MPTLPAYRYLRNECGPWCEHQRPGPVKRRSDTSIADASTLPTESSASLTYLKILGATCNIVTQAKRREPLPLRRASRRRLALPRSARLISREPTPSPWASRPSFPVMDRLAHIALQMRTSPPVISAQVADIALAPALVGHPDPQALMSNRDMQYGSPKCLSSPAGRPL